MKFFLRHLAWIIAAAGGLAWLTIVVLNGLPQP